MSVVLDTGRLLLRPPQAADISHFMPLLGDYDVAANMSRVPHPYTEDDGCAFVVMARYERAAGRSFAFSVVRKRDGTYLGMCGIHPQRSFELGYWIGKPYWGCGYATEAASRVVLFAFDALGAEAIVASCFADNPASGRVLAKLGFRARGNEMRVSLSRGCPVYCHMMVLERPWFTQIRGAA
jgi:RimJ/RimL family protein N-acetyltransferase